YEKYKNSLLNFDRCYQKSMRIEPRNAFACELVRYCRCAIDISDGLVGDLRHILEQSKVGASINVDSLPKASELHQLEEEYADRLCLFGGGDYELLFTLDDSNAEEVLKLAAEYNINVTQIGTIKNRQLDFIKHGKIVEYNFTSFEHF
ncbi:MAG: AIR synthase-related protein, partial [Succinivibrio sp.]